MSKKVIIERSSKERIESITIGDEKFSLHDDFNYADGGTMVKFGSWNDWKEYEEGDWDVNESFSMEDDKNVLFEKSLINWILKKVVAMIILMLT